jgi:hypothetical protein
LEAVGSLLTRSLEHSLHQVPNAQHCNIGIYLDTGSDWSLLGANPVSGRLPRSVTAGYDQEKLTTLNLSEAEAQSLNAFAWVHRSTRPVLLRLDDISAVWSKKLQECKGDFSKKLTGVCLVPLLDLNRPGSSNGVILMTTEEMPSLLPAHLFLLSRFSLSLSAYLSPLFPIPGFPWWPEVRMGRGGDQADPKWYPEAPVSSGMGTEEPAWKSKINKIVNEVTPTGSTVVVRPLKAGLSGAGVFQLEVKDKEGHLEIPRVLKVGPEKTIAQELKAYYRFVHNNRVGVAARVDVARLWQDPSTNARQGAILYTLAGAGDKAELWSDWAKKADQSEIEKGLADLRKQLWFWYSKTEPDHRSAHDLLIKPLFTKHNGKTVLWRRANLTKPGPDEVCHHLLPLLDTTRKQTASSLCVVHGDLHARNLFALLTEGRDALEQYVGVALIDWGNVGVGHPLIDIARLTVDLIYNVRWKEPSDPNFDSKWAAEQVRTWPTKDPKGSNDDWRLALIYQVTKMLFWCEHKADGQHDETKPYLEKSARAKAWADLKGWVKECLR